MLGNSLAIASVSLGQHAAHDLPRKINAAADSGIRGIEITYPDLEDYAKNHSASMIDAAQKVQRLCQERNLTILAFASFQNFEGNKLPLSTRLQEARRWLDLAHALGALHLQMPANYQSDATGDRVLIVSELRQLSDLAASYRPVMKIAYENLAWSTHCDLWQQALQTVIDVNRDNFGLCLDSFHICVSLWADPYVQNGRQADGDQKLKDSLRDLVQKLPLDKLFYLQLSDGERLDPTYSESHPWYDPTLAPGHVWSNEARPFPLEQVLGAYMPVKEVAQAFLVDLGFKGWVSLETFDRRMKVEHCEPRQNAYRAVKSWKALGDELYGSVTRSSKL